MPKPEPTISLDRFTTFGDLLKFLRRRQGLTQRELSIAVGYSHAQISRLELNQRLPDLATIAARFVPALDLEDEPATAARLLDLATAMQRDDAPASGATPFKGLSYFDEPDADLFFGREALTTRLVERLVTPNAAPVRFLALVGASGSGKSSLVRAGVIPALRWRRAAPTWGIHTFTPTAHPLQALATLNASEAAAPADRLLLVVDQFEEVFTLCRAEAERRAFIDQLLDLAAAPQGRTWVVLTLRADFYAPCAPYAALRAALAAQQEFLGPMTAAELRRAIEEPARRGGWELQDGLVDVLLKDLGADGRQPPEPGALPLLSHALLETWHRRRGRTLTLSGYLASGGVSGAIAETADVLYHDELDADQQTIARDIFLRLTQLGEEDNAPETRRRVPLDELLPSADRAAVVRAVLTRLADARLVTTADGVVEVAHEALIREWPTLRAWLEADRDGLRLHRHLTLAAEAWQAGGREAGDLYRGARLAQAAEWAAAHPTALNPAELAFLSASQAEAQRAAAEREDQRQRELEAARTLAETQTRAARTLQRRALYLSVALVLAMLMAGAALYFGEQARQSALHALQVGRLATARELAAAAVNNLEVDPERSLLLALQAISTTRAVGEPVLPEAEAALHQGLLASRVLLSLPDVGTRVLSAVYSPDGRRVAGIGDTGEAVVWEAETGGVIFRLPGTTVVGDSVGTQRIAYRPDGRTLVTGDSTFVKVWDAATGTLVMELPGHTAEVWSVAYSPNGAHLASADAAGELRVWEAATGQAVFAVSAHPAAIEALAFSPDGALLATVGDDNALRVWEAATGELVREITDLPLTLYGVAFSPDGRFLAGDTLVWETEGWSPVLTLGLGSDVAYSPDGLRLATITGSGATIWDAQTGQALLTLVGHTDWPNTVEFSPDGQRLLTSSMDGTVRTWHLGLGRESVALAAGGAKLAYSPDGRWLATEGFDGQARIWDAATGALAYELPVVESGMWGIAWSSDGARLAIAGADGVTRVWGMAEQRFVLSLARHGDQLEDLGLAVVRDVAFNPNGNQSATAGFDGTARLWDAQTGVELHRLEGHLGFLVLGVAFSPNGALLATTSTDGNLMLWDTATGEQVLAWHSHDGANPDVAFSPDGTRLLTGGSDTLARVWDAATGELLLTLAGHQANLWGVAYSPDGQRLATASADGTARVWDAESGALLSSLPGSQGDVVGVAFSPQDGGRQLAVGSADGVARVFILNLDNLLALAHARLTRGLTLGECQTFLHRAECPPAP